MAQTHGGDRGGAATPKRLRRPNVRLADPGAGDLVYYDPFIPRQQRRSTKKQKVSEKAPSDVNLKKKSGIGKNVEDEEDELDGVAIGMWKARVSKSKSRKTESNDNRKKLSSKVVDENRDESGNGEIVRNFEPIREEEEEEEEEGDENRDESTPVRSMDKDDSDNDEDDDVNENVIGDNGVEKGRGKELRFQVSDEMDDPSDLAGKDGVKVWLKKLGLQRYAPVFEIHEVDDEVLPLLTLEDLKDMGITAVGSRRKMFCSIQNLD